MTGNSGNISIVSRRGNPLLHNLYRLILLSAAYMLIAGSIRPVWAADQTSRFTVRVETAYERTALNYNLLLVDTTSVSVDSLEQLQKSADTRTEPSAGLRAMLTGKGWHLDNGIYYAASGWREQFDGRGQFIISDVLSVRSQARFDYRQENREDDSLLSDYWNMAGDVRLLAALTERHTAFVRADGERLQYIDQSPAVGYDYNRLRSRIGWRWQSANFDFMELAAGFGRRFVPDSTDREYAERYASFYSNFGLGERHRISLDLQVNSKDYESTEATGDYSLATMDARWDYRPHISWLLSTRLRWDYWDFHAEDELSSDFHEFEPSLELKVPLGESWAFRCGPRLRVLLSPDSSISQAEYRQPSGIAGIEYLPLDPMWAELRVEVGYRDYDERLFGYSDYTLLKLDLTGDVAIGGNWSCAATANYEVEFHADNADDTDFLFFSVRLAYHLLK